jgi:hypothetical protein
MNIVWSREMTSQYYLNDFKVVCNCSVDAACQEWYDSQELEFIIYKNGNRIGHIPHSQVSSRNDLIQWADACILTDEHAQMTYDADRTW